MSWQRSQLVDSLLYQVNQKKRGNSLVLRVTGIMADLPKFYGRNHRGQISRYIVVFTVAKGGLMYEAAIGGQPFSYAEK
ncbi:MAG: hypothetical protein DRR04_02160 [Gammaproteobacteria bacterium]|nr:MAG: hypothetical protein DRR04_02160 [Gammaproteobacteria bacterium]